MKRLISYSLLLFMVYFALATACAPQAGPAQAPAVTPVASPLTSEPASKAAPALSPEEAAWAKIVEAARKEGKLTIYSYGFVSDIGIAIGRSFEGKYGIKLDIITGRGAEFVERLRTEQRTGQTVADIFESSSTHVANAKKAGLTIPAGPLPELANKEVWYLYPLLSDPEGYIVDYYPFYLPPAVNTNLIKPQDEPKSWQDLLQPSWKGKMMGPDPAISTALYELLGLVRHEVLNMQYIQALGKQELKFVRSTAEASTLLARGEYPLAVFITPADLIPFAQEGAPVKLIDMKEGMVAKTRPMAIVKGGPHPNAARLFVNWILSEEGQILHARVAGVDPIRKGVPSYMPAPLRLTPSKPVLFTETDIDEISRAFREKVLLPIFKK